MQDFLKIVVELLPVLLPVLLECFQGMDARRQRALIRYLGTPEGCCRMAELGLAMQGEGDELMGGTVTPAKILELRAGLDKLANSALATAG